MLASSSSVTLPVRRFGGAEAFGEGLEHLHRLAEAIAPGAGLEARVIEAHEARRAPREDLAAVQAHHLRAEDEARGPELLGLELDDQLPFAAHRREVLDLVRGHDVELVGVDREVVLPAEAQGLEELAACALHEEHVADVVQDVQRVEVVEVDTLRAAVRRTDGHGLPSKTRASAPR
jgi:hypothetical protein